LAADPILELDAVVAGYGAMTILNGLSFAVRRGAITTVIGPNGAGKSTAFKAIFGLLRPRSGAIRFEGREAARWSQRELISAGVCYIPQGRNIFPELSVRHNIELGAAAASPSQRTDLPARLEAALDRFPVLRQKADRQASPLSGGEQKQLEIARGLLQPSIGLSPRMAEQTFALLRGLRDRGTTNLMIEQNARAALLTSDDGIVLELGRTRLHDRAPAILANPRVGELFLGGAMEEVGGD
jgi:branched-chain amino acid transport system ATP-binding protein